MDRGNIRRPTGGGVNSVRIKQIVHQWFRAACTPTKKTTKKKQINIIHLII